jgi:hypothetical protein
MSGIPGTMTPCDSQAPAERSEVGAWESLVSLTAASSPTPGWRTRWLVQLHSSRPDPGRDASGSSNLLCPGCTLRQAQGHTLRQARSHRTGYTGDLTERSRPRPLDALTDIPFEDAKSACGRWLDGSLTSRVRLNDVIPLGSFLYCRGLFRCRNCSSLSGQCSTHLLRFHFCFAGEQALLVERFSQHRQVPQGQSQATHDANQCSAAFIRISMLLLQIPRTHGRVLLHQSQRRQVKPEAYRAAAAFADLQFAFVHPAGAFDQVQSHRLHIGSGAVIVARIAQVREEQTGGGVADGRLHRLDRLDVTRECQQALLGLIDLMFCVRCLGGVIPQALLIHEG